MSRTGADALVESLVSEGVTDVFGLPGLQLDPAMDSLSRARDSVTLHPVAHEQAATYMADGYARTSGKPGVAMVVPGPGMLNATAGLATALACSSPVVALVGQIRSDLIGRGFGALHEIPDQTAVLASLTKWNAVARHPDEIPGLVHEAFAQARSGIQGPVAIELPPDVLRALTSAPVGLPNAIERPAPAVGDLDRIADLVRGSVRPLLVVGGGARSAQAGAAILDLGRALGAPIVMTRNARGVLDVRDDRVFDPIAIRRAREDADLVIAIGSRLGSTDGDQADLGTGSLVIADLDPRMFRAPRRPDIAVPADAEQFARTLADHLRRAGIAPSDAWDLSELASWSTDQLAPLRPQLDYLDAIRGALPEDGVFVSEYTQVGYVASVAYPVFHPGTFISPGYQGTLGYGFATALGAQVGAGTRPVVSVTGDGGFAWTLPELATAKREGIPLVTVVFTDGHYGNVRRIQKEEFDERYIASTLTNPDFVALAAAYGVAAERVEGAQALGDALGRAIGARVPTLIEVPVGEFPSPWGLIDAL